LALFTGGPSQLSSHCSGIVQLCTIQQLAADLAVRQPVEGTQARLNWLKHLLMGLIFNPSATGLDEKTQLVPLMSGVLAHLRGAEARMLADPESLSTSGISDSGVCLSPTSTSSAAASEFTDLRMIIALMSTKY
jgi:hypothetical protein